MLFKFGFFCVGCGLIQQAYWTSPAAIDRRDSDFHWSGRAMKSPLWMSSVFGTLLIPILAVVSLLAEVVIGTIFLRWWYGLLGIFFGQLIAKLVRASNPMVPLTAGMVIVVVASILLAW